MTWSERISQLRRRLTTALLTSGAALAGGRAGAFRVRGERAATLVEYLFLVALIAVACLVSFGAFVDNTGGLMGSASSSIVR